MTLVLRAWQSLAYAKWLSAGRRGIIEVVTGGGKTVFALHCLLDSVRDTTLITVPTTALLDQWWEECSRVTGLRLDDINIVTGRRVIEPGTINIAVLNTAARLSAARSLPPVFLVVDECHRAASEEFRRVLAINKTCSLGLSATPERQYDNLLDEVLVPALGPRIFSYSYRDAVRDGVIVPFELRNVIFSLEEDLQSEYDRLTKRIAKVRTLFGEESQEVMMLLLRRARVGHLSPARVAITLEILAAHAGQRVIVFHEDIEACEIIHRVLAEVGVPAGLYHSRMTARERAGTLADYRGGSLRVLVTCRALDEGFNVPETEVGIVAASTATTRQRIQRLGRVLRPAAGKSHALVYTLAGTSPEIERLQAEEEEMEGLARVVWSRA